METTHAGENCRNIILTAAEAAALGDDEGPVLVNDILHDVLQGFSVNNMQVPFKQGHARKTPEKVVSLQLSNIGVLKLKIRESCSM